MNDEMVMGGVARVLNTLMASLDKEKYEIDCLVLHKHGELLDEIPTHVTILEGTSFFDVVDLPLKEVIQQRKFIPILKKIRLLIYMKTGLIQSKIRNERKKMLKKRYDVEFAAKEGFCTLFTAFGNSKKKLNWVLTDYRVHNYSRRHMKLMKKALKFIDLNIADSKDALEAYEEVFGLQGGCAIHNLMDTEKVLQGMKEESKISLNKDILNVIVVARFHPQKRVERVILAHKEAIEKGINHHLYLIGGGPDEKMLRDLVEEYQLKTVTFLGFQKNPYALLAKCDLFVLSSEYEGFATIVNESLIATTPVLATRVSGITDQLINPEHGWIVENNQEDLNKGYCEALSNPHQLQQMKVLLQEYNYPNDQIVKAFEKVFE